MKDIQDIKIGLIGGGQLGKMILSEANRMNLKTLVLDSNKNSPCKNLCNNFYIGKLDNYNDILKFGKRCDIITFEIEHINIDALLKLENIGKKVYPKPHTLSIVQDKSKLHQKVCCQTFANVPKIFCFGHILNLLVQVLFHQLLSLLTDHKTYF